MPESVPGYYVWEAPAKSVRVQLNLETLERLNTVVMTGFGAIPRRGAEVGGILIGSVLPRTDLADASTIIRVDEFEAVPCSYKLGPSYLLSDADSAAFAEAVAKWKPGPGKDQYAVGYYRSNTRDHTTLGDEDRDLCARHFPPPAGVVLLIKPYASKVSQAGFITYENGRLDAESAKEFPFRRSEIEGTASPARRPLTQRQPRAPRRGKPALPEPAPAPLPVPAPREEAPEPGFPAMAEVPQPYSRPFEVERAPAPTIPSRAGRGWLWLPMSFLFLLLGVLLGFQSALTMYPNRGNSLSKGEDPYSMKLTVTKADDSLDLRWDREAAVFRLSPSAKLRIEDGTTEKEVDLDKTQLQNGSVTYRYLTKRVRFQLEAVPNGRTAVSEAIEWRE